MPAILAGTKPPVTSDSGYITVGGADEAIVREGLRTSLAPDAGCSHLAEPTLPKSSFEQIERFTEAATGTVYPRLIEALGVVHRRMLAALGVATSSP